MVWNEKTVPDNFFYPRISLVHMQVNGKRLTNAIAIRPLENKIIQKDFFIDSK